MKVKVRFVLSLVDDNLRTSPAGNAMGKVKGIIKKYAMKETWIGDRMYLMDQDDALFRQVIDLHQQYSKEIELIILDYHVTLTDEEEKAAVAFIGFLPQNQCEEYDDLSYEYIRCDGCPKEDRSGNAFYVNPTGYIKRKQDEFGMAWLDGTHEIVFLPKLIEAFEQEGVDVSYFKPVLSKRKVILGYVLDTDNILPKGSFYNPNYKLGKVCSECGAIIMKKDKDTILQQPKALNQEGLDSLKDVNFSYEYFNGYRELIISPKVQQIISKHVDKVDFMPVFLE